MRPVATTVPVRLAAGDVAPTNAIAISSASPGRCSTRVTRPTPTVVGGPNTHWPTPASTRPTEKPRWNSALASSLKSLVLPASPGPVREVRGAVAPASGAGAQPAPFTPTGGGRP